MQPNEVVIDALGRVRKTYEMVLDGLTSDQLTFRPAEQANPIGWLAWHLTRVQDAHIAQLAGRPQVWIEAGWHTRFGRPAEPGDRGFGMTAEQVAAFEPQSPDLLIAYHAAVHTRSLEYLRGVTPEDMDRVLDETRWNPPPTVGVRLVSVANDCTQHVGQMAYLRGLIENRHWFRA